MVPATLLCSGRGAHSSAGERPLHTREVPGSIPGAPIAGSTCNATSFLELQAIATRRCGTGVESGASALHARQPTDCGASSYPRLIRLLRRARHAGSAGDEALPRWQMRRDVGGMARLDGARGRVEGLATPRLGARASAHSHRPESCRPSAFRAGSSERPGCSFPVTSTLPLSHDAAMRREFPTGTVTFLFTDVEGSTKLLHELGAEAYAEALAEHRRVIREACAGTAGSRWTRRAMPSSSPSPPRRVRSLQRER